MKCLMPSDAEIDQDEMLEAFQKIKIKSWRLSNAEKDQDEMSESFQR